MKLDRIQKFYQQKSIQLDNEIEYMELQNSISTLRKEKQINSVFEELKGVIILSD